jgi:hypothetical protein
MRTWPFVVLSVFLPMFVLGAAANGSDADRLIAEALKPATLEADLRRLTDEIGGRVPGTPAMQRAVQWGVESFKAAGADSAHTEAVTSVAPSTQDAGKRKSELIGLLRLLTRALVPANQERCRLFHSTIKNQQSTILGLRTSSIVSKVPLP